MNVQSIKNIAKDLGTKTDKLSKTCMVQTIQLFEGKYIGSWHGSEKAFFE